MRRARRGRTARPLAAVLAAALIVAACGGGDEPVPDVEEAADPDPADTDAADGDGDGDAPDAEVPDADDEAEDDPGSDDPEAPDASADDADAEPPVDPAEVGADELGVVPVLMYHQLREDGGSVYDMTPEEYRAELEWLFEEGFRPITTSQLARGEIDVPAGTMPVVLTYDDSTASQAQLTEDGQLDPDTALGMLVEIAARYDDAEPRASVYVISGSLFGGTAAGEQVLEVLHGHGMELGNHTHTHPSLASIDAESVREELATNVAVVTDLVADAEVTTLSLPLGIWPEPRELAVAGSFASVGEYEHEGVLLVGSNPAPSPFHAEFDPLAIPRIRTSVDADAEYESAWWFEVMASSERWRPYVSDGNPATISFPADRAEELDPAHAERANPY